MPSWTEKPIGSAKRSAMSIMRRAGYYDRTRTAAPSAFPERPGAVDTIGKFHRLATPTDPVS
jgi:hypothetical protein